MAQQQLATSDPALDAYDRPRAQYVINWPKTTAASFLTKFQSTAACLGLDERIKLEVIYAPNDMEPLEVVLADPQASKVCSLIWKYSGEENVDSVIPLLISNCPELASLEVKFKRQSAFDFISSVLEHPDNKVKELEVARDAKGDPARFFAALGQSQVSALILTISHSPEFYRGLCDYLAKDLLVRLEVWMDNKRVPSEMMMSLATCTCLAKLEVSACEFFEPTAFTHLPKSITKLKLYYCTFVGGFDWSFLADSGVRELDLSSLKGVDGNQLGSALAAHLRAKGLDKLHFRDCACANSTLIAAGLEIGRIKVLEIGKANDASVERIALALQSPNNELRKLMLGYHGSSVRGIENHLVPALKHPNCNLAKLSLVIYDAEHLSPAKRVEDRFRKRCGLFVLLQGQQVRRLYCPLRRLPVEMFRMVGMVLM